MTTPLADLRAAIEASTHDKGCGAVCHPEHGKHWGCSCSRRTKLSALDALEKALREDVLSLLKQAHYGTDAYGASYDYFKTVLAHRKLAEILDSSTAADAAGVDMENNWKQYKRKGLSEMRPYVPGEDLTHISVSETDTPELGGMVARNPQDHADQWYVSKKYFEDNLELA